jgi:hypothetical protein
VEESPVSHVRCFDAGAGNWATVAVFSIIYAVMIGPLPFADPARLAAVFQSKIANLGTPNRRHGSPAHGDDPVICLGQNLGLKKVGKKRPSPLSQMVGDRGFDPRPPRVVIVRRIPLEIGSAKIGHRVPLSWICRFRTYDKPSAPFLACVAKRQNAFLAIAFSASDRNMRIRSTVTLISLGFDHPFHLRSAFATSIWFTVWHSC